MLKFVMLERSYIFNLRTNDLLDGRMTKQGLYSAIQFVLFSKSKNNKEINKLGLSWAKLSTKLASWAS